MACSARAQGAYEYSSMGVTIRKDNSGTSASTGKRSLLLSSLPALAKGPNSAVKSVISRPLVAALSFLHPWFDIVEGGCWACQGHLQPPCLQYRSQVRRSEVLPVRDACCSVSLVAGSWAMLRMDLTWGGRTHGGLEGHDSSACHLLGFCRHDPPFPALRDNTIGTPAPLLYETGPAKHIGDQWVALDRRITISGTPSPKPTSKP
jgi:hypothetical protein